MNTQSNRMIEGVVEGPDKGADHLFRAANRRGRAMRYLPRFILLTTTVMALAACNAFDRVTEIGDAPKLSSIEDPTHTPGYTPVKMPMPPPSLSETEPNSLWQTGARAFFRDQRVEPGRRYPDRHHHDQRSGADPERNQALARKFEYRQL